MFVQNYTGFLFWDYNYSALPTLVQLDINQIRQRVGSNLAIGLCIATAFLVVALRVFMVRKSKNNRQGSVADLVRRGQLRSDRRGMYDS